MLIKTKKFRLEKGTYIRLAFYNILRQQWWVGVLLLGAACGLVFYKYHWWAIVPLVVLVLYFAFWWLQFYGITTLADNQLLFERVEYQLNGQQIVMALSAKQGMAIGWEQIRSARKGKNYFLLFLSKAQLIYLPYKVFSGSHEIELLSALLRRKKLIG